MIPLLLSLTTLFPAIQDVEPKPTPQSRPASAPAQQGVSVKAKRKGHGTSLMRSMAKGIDWLAKNQMDDGRWHSISDENEGKAKGNDALDVGVTGLAILAMISEGHDLGRGKHKDRVAKAVAWLTEQQDAKTGCIGTRRTSYAAYNHALATWAMVEAWASTKDAKLKVTIEKALKHTQVRRNPYKVWRYSMRDGDNDSSITGWMMLGLLAAEKHGLIDIKRSKQMVLTWYDEVTDPNNGQVGYTRRGEGSARNLNQKIGFPSEQSEALTALSLLIRLRCGQKLDDKKSMALSLERILAIPPQWTPESGNIDVYYWFFGAMALTEAGSAASKNWIALLMPTLTKSQIPKGEHQGSWPAIGAWGSVGGRTYMSALSILCLSAATGRSRLLGR